MNKWWWQRSYVSNTETQETLKRWCDDVKVWNGAQTLFIHRKRQPNTWSWEISHEQPCITLVSVIRKKCTWKLCTFAFVWNPECLISSLFYFFPLALLSNSSLVYLKLTLSSFIHQGRISQRKELEDWRISKRGTLNKGRETGMRRRVERRKVTGKVWMLELVYFF